MKVKQIIKSISGHITIASRRVEYECPMTMKKVGSPLCGCCEYEDEDCSERKCTNCDGCQDCKFEATCTGVETSWPQEDIWSGTPRDLPIKFAECTVENLTAYTEKVSKRYAYPALRILVKEIIR